MRAFSGSRGIGCWAVGSALVLAIGILMGMTGCTKDLVNPLAALATPTPQPGMPSPLYAIVTTYQCSNCHFSAGSAPFLDLTSRETAFNQLVGVTATQGSCAGTRVVAGDATSSVLIQRLEGICSPQMPYGGPYLGLTEIQQFKDWIDAGANPGN